MGTEGVLLWDRPWGANGREMKVSVMMTFWDKHRRGLRAAEAASSQVGTCRAPRRRARSRAHPGAICWHLLKSFLRGSRQFS